MMAQTDTGGGVGGNAQYKETSKNAATNEQKAWVKVGTATGLINNKANDVKDPDSGKKDDPGSGGGGYYGGGGSGGGAAAPAAVDWASKIQSNPDVLNQYLNPNGKDQTAYLEDILKGNNPEYDVDIGKLEHINIDEEKAMLDQMKAAQEEQAVRSADRAVQQGTTDLQRQMQDAQEQFQTQRDQIDADEARSKDNQALYAEARGDRGGIGQAQYDAIQNNAATLRYNTQKEQASLAQDVKRQITDLRAQGEYQKADQLLNIAQNYLGQLMTLYQWAKETNLGVDEFNIQIDQWKENYKMNLLNAELSIADATGTYADGTPTYKARMAAYEMLANSGNALMQAGVAPTAEQLVAMGMTADQAVAYLKKYYPYG